ncbi:MAG: DUF2793 domain-containing protein [Propylenella sp.]
MPETASLGLPLLVAEQAQKHVTHNEALLLLDAHVRTRVVSQGLTTPPGSPADGSVYIPGSGATGAWDDWDFNLAYYVDGAWQKIVPKVGWVVFDIALGEYYRYVGAPTYWSPLSALGSAKPFLVVAGGQSNMLGADSATDGSKTGHAGFFAWDYSAEEFNLAALGANPFNTAASDPNNLAFHFCKRLAEETGRAVYLVLYAVDGSSISGWNSTHFPVLDGYVNDAIASPELIAAGLTQADVMLWHQGEADEATAAATYRSGLETLIASARAADWGSARMPFVAGELFRGADKDEQNGTLRRMASDGKDLYLALASSTALTSVGDAVHFNGASLVTLGAERYYAEFANLPRFYPASQARETLTAARSYYCNDSTGDDGNDGQASGSAFATLQKAIDEAAKLDSSIYDVTINVAAGTYAATGLVAKNMVGAGKIVIIGDETTPANVVIESTNSGGITLYSEARTLYELRGARLTHSGGGTAYGIRAERFGVIKFQNVEFNTGYFTHIRAADYGIVEATGNYSIIAGASVHWWAVTGQIRVVGRTVTLTGTPAFSGAAFALCQRLAAMVVSGNTFSGSATGKRYDVSENADIFTNGGGATYLPGNAAGSTATGGQYV